MQRLVDAAPSQLGKDLVKVSDSIAQQLSYKILTAPISMFGGSVVFDKAVSKGLSAAEAAKTAGKFSGGVYTGGMALSSAADKYVQCRSEGQGKLEASVRALGTGAISYFTESLGGIGGSKSPLNGLEEKYAESIIGSILYNAFEEGGEEFLEYSADILLDGAVDLAARGEWQQEWDWAEVIENAKIGAMTGGLFGGYQKLGDIKEAVDRKIDAKKAAKLEKAVREYCDYMKNAYRLMNDPNLREIAERQIGDTTIPAATRMNRSETGEMNFGDVLPKKAGTVSFEQMYGTKPPDGTENQSFEEWAARKDAEKKKAAEKKATLAEKQKNADSRSIRTDMTDDERYEALKNEKIKIEPYNSEKLKGENIEELSSKPFKEARKYIKTLAEKFEVFKKYASEKAKIEFKFSKNNLIESEIKQGKLKSEYAEMLSATDAIIQNAVLIEAHKDRYAGTEREDKTLLQTDVLLSAFADENGIVPVRLTVKEFKDKDNSLYALITLEKIETEIKDRGESFATTPTPYPVSEMSIPDIVSKIKPTDGKILKYLPDKLLSTEQLEGKRAALAKDKEKIEGFSQKGDSAAGTQQKNGNGVNISDTNPFENTESKAATGTEKSIGEDIRQKAQELIDETKKRKADAEVTDEKLKGMSTKRQDEVLKERAEKAGIDMTPEELVDFAQSMGRIKGLFGGEFKDFARILDDVSGRSEAIRNTLHKLFERPFRQAQSQYTQNYKRAVEHISKKFSELGIKAGSKESAAVQRIGEHAYQIDSKGNTAEYTYEMLERDFPGSWEKIAEAAKFTRNIYDDYLKNLNEMYEKIYPNTLEKAEAYKNKVREKSVREFKKASQLGKYARGLETNLMCGLF